MPRLLLAAPVLAAVLALVSCNCCTAVVAKRFGNAHVRQRHEVTRPQAKQPNAEASSTPGRLRADSDSAAVQRTGVSFMAQPFSQGFAEVPTGSSFSMQLTVPIASPGSSGPTQYATVVATYDTYTVLPVGAAGATFAPGSVGSPILSMSASPAADGSFVIVTTLSILRLRLEDGTVLTTHVAAIPAGANAFAAREVPTTTAASGPQATSSSAPIPWLLQITLMNTTTSAASSTIVNVATMGDVITVHADAPVPTASYTVATNVACDVRLCTWAYSELNVKNGKTWVLVQDAATGAAQRLELPVLAGATEVRTTLLSSSIVVATWRTVVGLALKPSGNSFAVSPTWHKVLGSVEAPVTFVGTSGGDTLLAGTTSRVASAFSELSVMHGSSGNLTATFPLPANETVNSVKLYPAHSILIVSSEATGDVPIFDQGVADIRALRVAYDYVTKDVTGIVTKTPVWQGGWSNSTIMPLRFAPVYTSVAVANTLAPLSHATTDCVALPIVAGFINQFSRPAFLFLRVTDGLGVLTVVNPYQQASASVTVEVVEGTTAITAGLVDGSQAAVAQHDLTSLPAIVQPDVGDVLTAEQVALPNGDVYGLYDTPDRNTTQLVRVSPTDGTVFKASITLSSFNESAFVAVYPDEKVAIVWGTNNDGVIGMDMGAYIAAVDTETGATLWTETAPGLSWNLVHPLADRAAVFIAPERGLMGSIHIRDARTGAITASSPEWPVTANFDCSMSVADERPGEFLASSCVFVAVVSTTDGSVAAYYNFDMPTYGWSVMPTAAFTPRSTFSVCVSNSQMVVAVDMTGTTVGFYSVYQCPAEFHVSHTHDVVYATILQPESPVDVPPFNVYVLRLNFTDFLGLSATIGAPFSVETMNSHVHGFLDDTAAVFVLYDLVDETASGFDLLTGQLLWSRSDVFGLATANVDFPQQVGKGQGPVVFGQQGWFGNVRLPLLAGRNAVTGTVDVSIPAPAFAGFQSYGVGGAATGQPFGIVSFASNFVNLVGLYRGGLATKPFAAPPSFRNATGRSIFPATPANTLPPAPSITPPTLPPFPPQSGSSSSSFGDSVFGKWWIWLAVGFGCALISAAIRVVAQRRGRRSNRAQTQPLVGHTVVGQPVNQAPDTSVQEVLV